MTGNGWPRGAHELAAAPLSIWPFPHVHRNLRRPGIPRMCSNIPSHRQSTAEQNMVHAGEVSGLCRSSAHIRADRFLSRLIVQSSFVSFGGSWLGTDGCCDGEPCGIVAMIVVAAFSQSFLKLECHCIALRNLR